MPPERRSLDGWLGSAAVERQRESRLRRRQVLRPVDAVRVHDGDRVLVNFSSNDYLGLAGHPELAAAAAAALEAGACGSAASALVTGYRAEHRELEHALADFLGREAVLLFSSGYLANLAVATSLVGRGDSIVQDRLCHASLIDGARLSGAGILRYRHRDVESCTQQLQRAGSGRRLLVTDGVFSMDGDEAPLTGLASLGDRFDAWLVVDDAHGIGVAGPQGRGTVAGLGERQVPVLIGTLGKAFGAAGAFVAGSRALVEHLVNEARSYLFTTAMPAAVAAAGRAGLRRVQRDDWRRDRLAELIALLRRGAADAGLKLLPSSTPIQPLLTGSAEAALALSAGLRERGFLVMPIRPPTVPPGTSRLRITLSAAHEPGQVRQLVEAIVACLANR